MIPGRGILDTQDGGGGTTMQHGLVFLSNADVVDAETNYLNSSYTLDIIPTTWNSANHARDSWWGPTWNGESGSGTSLEKKKQDMFDTFGTGQDRKLCLHYLISGVGDDMSNYQNSAGGSNDADYASWAADLVANDMEDTIIRPSAEFSSSWSSRYPIDPDTGDPAPQQYKDAFARCVREFHNNGGVSNDLTDDNFTFIYSPAGNSLNLTDDCWPTDSQYWPSGVPGPIVTPSLYDATAHWGQYTGDEIESMSASVYESNAQTSWNDYSEPKLTMYRNFADSVGAPMALIEWGPASISPTRYPNGGGDNPHFMEYAFDYMEQHDFKFQAVWNVNSNISGSHRVYPTNPPDLDSAGAVWKNRVLN